MIKLLEYDAREFLKKNKYKDGQKHLCAENGFLFGMHEFFGQDFWISKEGDYIDKDFIKIVYELNFEQNIMEENELLETLSRFLCGHDKQLTFRDVALQLPINKRHNFFLNKKDDLKDLISAKEINEKIIFIKHVLGI